MITYYSLPLKKKQPNPNSLHNRSKNIKLQQVTEKKASQVIEISSRMSLLLKIKIPPYNKVYNLLFFPNRAPREPGRLVAREAVSADPGGKGRWSLPPNQLRTSEFRVCFICTTHLSRRKRFVWPSLPARRTPGPAAGAVSPGQTWKRERCFGNGNA